MADVEALLGALVAGVSARGVDDRMGSGSVWGRRRSVCSTPFSDAVSSEAHLRATGEAVMAQVSELFTAAPAVDLVDIVTAKLPL